MHINLNIESTIISSIINSPTLIEKYYDNLKIKYFYNKSNKKILEIILNLFDTKKTITLDTIKIKLEKPEQEQLLNILIKNPINNLEDYLDILKDTALKQEIKQLANDINKSLDSNISGIELQSKISTLTQEITDSVNINIFDIENINNIEDKPVEFICNKWLPIPKHTVSLVSAPGGTGKSWFIMQLALRAIKEKKIDKVFLWLSEDPKQISKHRYNIIKKDILKYDDSVDKKIDISDSSTIQFLYDDNRKVEVSPLFSYFKAKLQEYDLIILDPLIAFYGTDENSNSNARRFMQLFTSWANKENKTIIFVHHSTKNKTQSRGASAFVDAVRTVYELDYVETKNEILKDSAYRLIKLTKDNYGIHNILKSYKIKKQLFPKKELEINEDVFLEHIIDNQTSYSHSDF